MFWTEGLKETVGLGNTFLYKQDLIVVIDHIQGVKVGFGRWENPKILPKILDIQFNTMVQAKQ